jgi:hypothetical protein
VIFYLGAHMSSWMQKVDVPLFVSYTRLRDVKKPKRALGSWALDSGGFTQIKDHGRFTFAAAEYVAAVRRYRDEIGNLQWAAPMDWMCETPMLAKTGLTVADHQARTVDNLLTLRGLAPELPIIPVLQGYELDDYLRCADLYGQAGIDLTVEPLVGVGSVCRRQATSEIERLLLRLSDDGYRLHGFGVKKDGLSAYSHVLTSADSMAWSFRGRHVPGCTPSHKAENNCLRFALEWRAQAMIRVDKPPFDRQMEMAL